MTKPLSEITDTLESLRAWIRGAGTEYEPTPPPQADADDALRSVLESLDLQAGANANLLAKNLRLEDETERLRADFADFREMHYDTKGEIERLRARIEAALAQLKRNLCDCREDDCHHCELVRLTVEALKGDK